MSTSLARWHGFTPSSKQRVTMANDNSREVVMAAARAAHNERAIDDPQNTHVYLLFGDGELSMTKCGSLFGQRSLLLINPPKILDGNTYGFPFKYNGFPCIVLDNGDEAERIREMM